MADNIELNLGVGGKIVATDDIGGIQHELVKVEFGTDGNATMVSTGNPLPVTDAATEVSVASIDLKTPSVGQKLMAASSPVVIASDQSAIPVTGPLTDTQLRATPVPVSGTIVTGGLTDTQLRATPVPVSGTVTVDTSALLTTADFDTKTGSLTETAPATDTASSGLNGRLQRIAQRISSLITALGSPFQAGGSIGNTSFAATQGTATNLKTQAETYQGGTAVGAASPLQVSLANTGANTNKLLVTPDSVALPANQSVNVAQVAGTTTKTNSGTGGAGSLNVYIATDQPALTNALQVKSTQKPSVSATTVMTVTNLQSLASSATAGWQSARVSNVPTTLANDYEIFVKLTTANTAPGSDKAAYVWVCPFYTTDAGTTWFASSQGTATLPTGTEGTTTIASPHNLRLLGVLNYTTQQMVLQDTFLLSNCFGNRLPDGFSIIITNFTGAALSTGCVVDYSSINDILV